MAHALVLPCQNLSSQILYSTQASLINNVNPPTSTKINLLRARGIAVMKESIPRTKNRRKPKFVVTLAANSGSDSTETSMSYAVKKLYTCINDKDLKQLEELVSDNCIVEDSAFPFNPEWEEDQIPFTRGCTIFQFSSEEDKLVIG